VSAAAAGLASQAGGTSGAAGPGVSIAAASASVATATAGGGRRPDTASTVLASAICRAWLSSEPGGAG
jgi:hypothetical protein